MRAICYKTKTPVIYSEGKTCDEFLAYGTGKSEEECVQVVENLNATKPSTLFNGEKIDWEKVDYFFYKNQEDF